MLEQNKTSDDEINIWISKLSELFGFPLRRINPGHWQLDIKNSQAVYTLDITDQGEWISFAAPLVADVEGKQRIDFYKTLLELNAMLNSAHIGLQENIIILSREELKENLNLRSFAQSIILVNNAYEVVYQKILEMLKNLDLRYHKE